jgi:hypothetical protein
VARLIARGPLSGHFRRLQLRSFDFRIEDLVRNVAGNYIEGSEGELEVADSRIGMPSGGGEKARAQHQEGSQLGHEGAQRLIEIFGSSRSEQHP